MRKYTSTIVLVLAAVVLAAWLWVDRDKVTEGERKRRENSVFTAWRREELVRVEIAHEGETLVLERDAKSDPPAWRMTSPRQERVDVQSVERLMTTLEFATIVRKPSEGGALGLSSPRATGSVQMGTLVVRFALGDAAPRPEGASYFRVDDGPPLVVSKELTSALLTPADSYRDRTVVPYLSLELSRFEVTYPGGGFALERHDDHAFRVVEAGVLAHRSAVDRLWGALSEMRAESFPKEADADRLTSTPRLAIKMTPKEASGKPVAELVVGDACPGHPDDVVVLRKAPTRVAACAPKVAVDALLATPGALVDKRPFSVAVDEMEEARLEWLAGDDAGARAAEAGRGASAPAAIELARKGKGFHQRAPEDRDLSEPEAAAATALLERIATTEADHVRRGGGAPFAPIARARVRFGEREQVVEVGAADPTGRAVLRRVIDDARLDVDAAALRRLVPRETSLRPLSPLTNETRRPTRVVLRCGAAHELEDRGEGFRLVEPKGYEADGSIVQLVEAVLRGKVESWVSDVDDGSFGEGPGDPCRVIFAFADGNAPLTLMLAKAGERGVYGRVESRPGIFVAPPSLRELASRIYVSRGSLRVEASRIERVRVTHEGKALPVEDEGALRAAVGSLFAERVLAIGPKAKAGLPSPDLVLDVAVAEGGAPRRIECRPPASDGMRICTTPSIDATFAVPAARFAPFGSFAPFAPAAPDAGVDASLARHGGPR